MNEMRYSVVAPHCFLLCSRQLNDMKCMYLANERLTQIIQQAKAGANQTLGWGVVRI